MSRSHGPPLTRTHGAGSAPVRQDFPWTWAKWPLAFYHQAGGVKQPHRSVCVTSGHRCCRVDGNEDRCASHLEPPFAAGTFERVRLRGNSQLQQWKVCSLKSTWMRHEEGRARRRNPRQVMVGRGCPPEGVRNTRCCHVTS